MPRLIRFLPWWLIVLAALLAAVWVFRVNLIGLAGEQLINNHNIRNLDYQLEDIDFSRINLSQLSFDLVSNDYTLLVESEDVTSAYSLETLEDRKADRLIVDRLRLEIRKSHHAEIEFNNPTNIEAILAVVAGLLGTSIPVNYLEIKHLSIAGDELTSFEEYEFAVVMDANDKNARILISYDEATLVIDKFAKRFTAKLLNPRAKHVFSAHLKLIDDAASDTTMFSGKILVDFGDTKYWLDTIFEEPLGEVSGQLSAQIQGTKRAQNNPSAWDVALTGTIEEAIVDEFTLSKTDFTLVLSASDELDFSNYIANLEKRSKIRIEGLKIGDLEIASATVSPLGELGFKDRSPYLSLEHPSTAEILKLSTTGMALTKAAISIDLDLYEKDDQLIIGLNPGVALVAEHISWGELDIIEPDLSLISSSQIGYNTNDYSNWALQKGDWKFKNLDVVVDDKLIRVADLSARTSTISPKQISLQFDGHRPTVRVSGMSHKFRRVSGTLTMEDRQIAIDGDIRLPDIPTQFNYRTKIDLDNKSGNYRIKQQSPMAVPGNSEALNTLISKWNPELSIRKGSLKFDLAGEWKKKGNLKHIIQLKLNGVGGEYAGITFSGLEASGPLTVPPSSRSDSASINVSHLEYGAEVENLNLKMRLAKFGTGPLIGIAVNDLRGEILGSTVESKAFKYDPNLDKNHVELSLQGLDVDKIVKMQEFEGLTASGRLGGKLPIDITANGIHIENGEIWNEQGGGTINYRIDPNQAKALSNPLTDVVLKTLEEFHYDVLTATVNYTPDGELFINFHIEGKNPNLDSTRPVHLNINSEQNVLSLLESLKYTNDLSQQLNDNISKKVIQ